MQSISKVYRRWLKAVRRWFSAPAPRTAQAEAVLKGDPPNPVLLVVADLAEDRQTLRHMAAELRSRVLFLQDLQRSGQAPPRCNAVVMVPATAARAVLLMTSEGAGVPAPWRGLPVFFVAPAGLGHADLARAGSLYAVVETKPLLLSALRAAILRMLGDPASSSARRTNEVP